MTEAEAIRKTREHLGCMFPRVCPTCGRRFETFREYLLSTPPLGYVMPYDAMVGSWNPERPLGTYGYANCECGTTMALSSKGMPNPQLWELWNWGKTETEARGISPEELMNHVRDEIFKQVLGDGRSEA